MITTVGSSNNIINDKKYRKQDSLSFKNSAAVTGAMSFLKNNEILGAFAVDVGSMVIPRVAIDASRTPEVAVETLRRESSSSVLLGGLGAFGVAAAYILSPFMKKSYGVPLYKIEANNSTMDAFASAFSQAVKTTGTDDKSALAKAYLNNIFSDISGEESLKFVKDDVVDTLAKYLTESSDYVISAPSQKNLFKKLVAYTGNTDNIKLALNGESVDIGAKALIKDSYSLGRAFMQDKVLKEFKNTDQLADNKFLKQLKKMTGKQTVLGLVMASAIAMSMQSINSWLTKKKTGQDGFSAVKGQKAEKDNSLGFKAMKATASAGMAAFALSSIGGSLKDLPKKLQFNGIVASVPQLKVVYGLTIIGRFLASRDKHELRESVGRDFLGFANWLILGGVVSNAVANKLDPNLIKQESIAGKKGLNKYLSMKVKNHNDLIYGSDFVRKSLKNGVDISSLSMKDILKRVDEPTKKMIKKLNIAQMSGYLYSGIALGVLVPLINKKLTQYLVSKDSKSKAESANEKTIASSNENSQRAQILSLKK